MSDIADARGWYCYAGLELLSQRGLIWYGRIIDGGFDWPAWVITDSRRTNAQARRLDGQVWQGIGGKKAKSLPGSVAAWPIGAPEIGSRPLVVLTEGGPDFCAAPLVAWTEDYPLCDVAPVCMTGAGNSIHPDAVHYFERKHVILAVHDDPAGDRACEQWTAQLYHAGAYPIQRYSFADLRRHDGRPVKDLADFATLLGPDAPISERFFPPVPPLVASPTASELSDKISPW